MKIHEYQSKALMSQYGISVPRSNLATKPEEAQLFALDLGKKVVVKAQVYAGGRGKAGGIKIADTPDDARDCAQQLLGKRLVTHQTGPEGVPVHKVLIEEALNIDRELYLSIMTDTSHRKPVIIASSFGGMDIEEVARVNPEKIIKEYIDPALGFWPYIGTRLAYKLGLKQYKVRPFANLLTNLYHLYMDKDCSLAEINPLVVTAAGNLVALDAKLTFDDNALFRHTDIAQMLDTQQEDVLEVEARQLGVQNYIKLDGNIGCLVNGAGLAMAVLDLINQAGGKPANFLDIGTVNNTARVVNAFKIFSKDPDVKAILVNIFGGMARVDVIAKGIKEACETMNIRLPLVIRLAGTNVEEGKKILKDSDVHYIEATGFLDAAQKAVQAAKGAAL